MVIMMSSHQTLWIYGRWTTDPFDAVERDGRLYGRGAADNKGPQIVHMSALARVFRDNPDYPLHITYLIEGEEEIGSPSFRGFLEEHKQKLQGDLLLVSDTGSPGADQLVVTTGLRGLSAMEVKIFGPKQDLHSGVHGGALLNPLQALIRYWQSRGRSIGSHYRLTWFKCYGGEDFWP